MFLALVQQQCTDPFSFSCYSDKYPKLTDEYTFCQFTTATCLLWPFRLGSTKYFIQMYHIDFYRKIRGIRRKRKTFNTITTILWLNSYHIIGKIKLGFNPRLSCSMDTDIDIHIQTPMMLFLFFFSRDILFATSWSRIWTLNLSCLCPTVLSWEARCLSV